VVRHEARLGIRECAAPRSRSSACALLILWADGRSPSHPFSVVAHSSAGSKPLTASHVAPRRLGALLLYSSLRGIQMQAYGHVKTEPRMGAVHSMNIRGAMSALQQTSTAHTGVACK